MRKRALGAAILLLCLLAWSGRGQVSSSSSDYFAPLSSESGVPCLDDEDCAEGTQYCVNETLYCAQVPDCDDGYQCTTDAFNFGTEACTHTAIPACHAKCYADELDVDNYGLSTEHCHTCETTPCPTDSGCKSGRCVDKTCEAAASPRGGCCAEAADCPEVPCAHAICSATMGVCQYFYPSQQLRPCNETDDCEDGEICYEGGFTKRCAPAERYEIYPRRCQDQRDCMDLSIWPSLAECFFWESSPDAGFCTIDRWYETELDPAWLAEPTTCSVACNETISCPNSYPWAIQGLTQNSTCVSDECLFETLDAPAYTCCTTDDNCTSSDECAVTFCQTGANFDGCSGICWAERNPECDPPECYFDRDCTDENETTTDTCNQTTLTCTFTPIPPPESSLPFLSSSSSVTPIECSEDSNCTEAEYCQNSTWTCVAVPDCRTRYLCATDTFNKTTEVCVQTRTPDCTVRHYVDAKYQVNYGEATEYWDTCRPESDDCLSQTLCKTGVCTDDWELACEAEPGQDVALGCCDSDGSCPEIPGMFFICDKILGTCQYYDPNRPLRLCNGTADCSAGEACVTGVVRNYCAPVRRYTAFPRLCRKHSDCLDLSIYPASAMCRFSLPLSEVPSGVCVIDRWHETFIAGALLYESAPTVPCNETVPCPAGRFPSSTPLLEQHSTCTEESVCAFTEEGGHWANVSCCATNDDCVSPFPDEVVWQCMLFSPYGECSAFCYPTPAPGITAECYLDRDCDDLTNLTADHCDLNHMRCVHVMIPQCSVDANCSAGEYCQDATRLCLSVPDCDDGLECTEDSFNLVTEECVNTWILGCGTANCKYGDVLYDGECVTCLSDTDCLSTSRCKTGRCTEQHVCEPVFPLPLGCCNRDSDCPTVPCHWGMCDTHEGVCTYSDLTSSSTLTWCNVTEQCSDGQTCNKPYDDAVGACDFGYIDNPRPCTDHFDCLDMAMYPYFARCVSWSSQEKFCTASSAVGRIDPERVPWGIPDPCYVPCETLGDCGVEFRTVTSPQVTQYAQCVEEKCVYHFEENFTAYTTCESDDDCDDHDRCTNDYCDSSLDHLIDRSICWHYHDDGCVPIECTTAAECDDLDRCTDDDCVDGVCSNAVVTCPAPGICGVSSCDALLGCIETPKCADGTACTEDVCNPATGECTHVPLDCDDGSACTHDWCDDVDGCKHDEISCADANLCTDDYCISEGISEGCNHDQLFFACPDDNDPCTEDGCNPLTGECDHVPIVCPSADDCHPGRCDPVLGCVVEDLCDDHNACTVDECEIVGSFRSIRDAPICTNTPIVCGTDPCRNYTCDPQVGCLPSVPRCDDNNKCTGDICTANGTCIHIWMLPPSDGDICTIDTCVPLEGFRYVAKCKDSDPCTTDLCDSVTGACTFEPIVCADDNACTIDECVDGECPFEHIAECCTEEDLLGCYLQPDYCHPPTCKNGTCDYSEIRFEGCCNDASECSDPYLCTDNICDPQLGCVFPPKSCDDSNLCMDDFCNATTGECYHVEVNCDDNNVCTTSDSCFPELGCVYASLQCEDFNECTIDTCDPVDGCVYTEMPAGTPCTDDGDECTNDVCRSGVCVHDPACVVGENCTEDDDCDDEIKCSKDKCVNGKCQYRYPGSCCATDAQCPNDGVCTEDFCDLSRHRCVKNVVSRCCITNAQCNDYNPCTTDVCGLSHTCQRTWTPGCCISDANCTDNDACTVDTCLPNRTCVHVDISPCCSKNSDCNDGDSCTRDRCVDGQCSNEMVPYQCQCSTQSQCASMDDPSKCVVGTCLLGVCVPVQACDDGDKKTEDVCNVDGTCSHFPRGNGPRARSSGTDDYDTECECRDRAYFVQAWEESPLPPDFNLADYLCPELLALVPQLGDGSSLTSTSLSIGQFRQYMEAVGELTEAALCMQNVPRASGGEIARVPLPSPFTPGPCSDGDLCTIDSCNLEAFGPACFHYEHNCDDNDACTSDICFQGECMNVPHHCPDSVGASCVSFECFEGDGLCYLADQSCAPTGPYGHDACLATRCVDGQIVHEPIDCNDHNGCTNDSCVSPLGVCLHTYACDDGREDTFDYCYFPPQVQLFVEPYCVHEEIPLDCVPQDKCTWVGHYDSGAHDSCDSFETGVMRCDDNNPCTDDICDPVSGCVFVPKVCLPPPGSDACMDAYCDPSDGQCVALRRTCSDGNPCTDDACDPQTGECSNLPLDCDDGEPCTLDICNEITGQCAHVWDSCNDHDACSFDVCVAGVGCTHTPLGDVPFVGDDESPARATPVDYLCMGHFCNLDTGEVAYYPINCDDGNACTTDTCSLGICHNDFPPFGSHPPLDEDCLTPRCTDEDTGVVVWEFKEAHSPCNSSDPCDRYECSAHGICQLKPDAPAECPSESTASCSSAGAAPLDADAAPVWIYVVIGVVCGCALIALIALIVVAAATGDRRDGYKKLG